MRVNYDIQDVRASRTHAGDCASVAAAAAAAKPHVNTASRATTQLNRSVVVVTDVVGDAAVGRGGGDRDHNCEYKNAQRKALPFRIAAAKNARIGAQYASVGC
jgi:hypothetical protein